MNIVTPQQMAAIESHAYRDGLKEEDFMEEAGKQVAKRVDGFVQKHQRSKKVYLLCGKGNNAGDAYVAGAALLQRGYDVAAYQIASLVTCRPLCQKKQAAFVSLGGAYLEPGNLEEELTFTGDAVIVDALFGTGFRGQVKEPYATAIRLANRSQLPLIALDIPSGLNGDTGEVEGEAICAVETVFLGLPKIGFFFGEGWNKVGKLRYGDFGLPQQYVDAEPSGFRLICPSRIRSLLPPLVRNRHKYQAGYVAAVAGSLDMPGAALLSSTAALRGGAGIVKLFHPEGMESALAASPYEVIHAPYNPKKSEELLMRLSEADAVYIGPGIGKDQEVRRLLKEIVPKLPVPCVLDADALTIIAEEKIPYPQHAVITPHVGEMRRLLGGSSKALGQQALVAACKEYVEKHGVTLVLKGGPTFLFHPEEPIYINAGGNPGMATAGSGDVLTGICAALLAQGVSCHAAALLGVYLHGVAGDAAEEEKTAYCLMASDIIEQLPQAFFSLLRLK